MTARFRRVRFARVAPRRGSSIASSAPREARRAARPAPRRRVHPLPARRWALAFVALALGVGCYDSHAVGGAGTLDGGAVVPTIDAATSADAAAPVERPVSSGDLRCGPNVCLAGEVCCDSVCGACTLPDECVDYECDITGG